MRHIALCHNRTPWEEFKRLGGCTPATGGLERGLAVEMRGMTSRGRWRQGRGAPGERGSREDEQLGRGAAGERRRRVMEQLGTRAAGMRSISALKGGVPIQIFTCKESVVF